MLLPQEESQEKKIWEDERIGIALIKLDRPDSTSSEGEVIRSQIPRLKKGWGGVLIYLAVVRVKDKDLFISYPMIDIDSSYGPYSQRKLSQFTHLLDIEGNAYIAKIAVFTPKKGFTLRYIRDSMGKLKATLGTAGLLVFVMPEEAKPAQLNYVYFYGEESMKPKERKYEHISIQLYKIKVKVEEAIIRLRSQTDSETVGNVPLGTVFVPEGKVGEWYEVSFRDKSGFTINGYIHESEVDVSVEIDGTPEIKEAIKIKENGEGDKIVEDAKKRLVGLRGQ